MAKEMEVSIWCRLGAYVKLPQSVVQEYFSKSENPEFDRLDFGKLYKEGKIEFGGDSYIPDESVEFIQAVNKEEHHCPHCGKPLIPSVVDGYNWQCTSCEEDFVNVELID